MTLRSFVGLTLALSVTLCNAWLPGERSLWDRNGISLFDNQTSACDETNDPHCKRWLSGKAVRGVSLGSQFIIEPWLVPKIWEGMGCRNTKSEFDCVSALGQDTADAKFDEHWRNFITEKDLNEMLNYGLNTIRIPVGYWMFEDLVFRDSEHFPRGAFKYLKQICGWASDRGFYTILDHHGAPGAQAVNNAFTGQDNPNPGFYQDFQFDRSYRFLSWLVDRKYEFTEFRNVGMIEVVNEPLQVQDGRTDFMRNTYYPNAYRTIREAENRHNIGDNDRMHIQFMNSLWGSGDPHQFLSNDFFAAYDDHRYLKWAGIENSKDNYLRTSCHDDRGVNWPTIVGEWSISAPDGDENKPEWAWDQDIDFYRRWFSAQVLNYERSTLGWVFWTWKTELGDPRWDYKLAVEKGIIPRDLNSIANSGACDGF